MAQNFSSLRAIRLTQNIIDSGVVPIFSYPIIACDGAEWFIEVFIGGVGLRYQLSCQPGRKLQTLTLMGDSTAGLRKAMRSEKSLKEWCVARFNRPKQELAGL